jgi:cyclohexanone monooxygenase
MTTCGPSSTPTGLDLPALREKYAAERDKRLRKEGSAQYVHTGHGERDDFFEKDPHSPPVVREPLREDVEVVVVGGGFAGLLAGAHLKKAGVEDVRILDMAGDFGGVWYWNRYPGIQCDNEAYCYMPLLEELGAMPSKRFPDGAEIYEHCRAIGKHFGLYDGALFGTMIRAMRRDETTRRWTITTNHEDELRARYVVMAIGPWSKPKLPGIPGLHDFTGHTFHSARWDYDYTGGAPGDTVLDRLHDKRVAVVGTGATAIQIVPYLARYAQHLTVFQRTPSAVDGRRNTHRPRVGGIARARVAEAAPGRLPHVRDRPLPDALAGRGGRLRLLHRGRPQRLRAHRGPLAHARRARRDPRGGGLRRHGADPAPRGRHRARPRDGRGPQALLPLPVQAALLQQRLPGGLQPAERHAGGRVGDQGHRAHDADGRGDRWARVRGRLRDLRERLEISAQDQQLASGIDAIDGRDGLSLYDHWRDGFQTLHGITSHGFPGLFFTGNTQGGGNASVTANYVQQGEHIAYLIAERTPAAPRRSSPPARRRTGGSR